MDPHDNQHELYGWLLTIFYIKAPYEASISIYRAGTQRSGSERKRRTMILSEYHAPRDMELNIIDEELVTRTGFEPMLTA